MAIIAGLKSTPYAREVRIVTDAPYAVTVAYCNNPKLKNMDLIHLYRYPLIGLKPTFKHISGHRGHWENELVDTLASRAAHGRIGGADVPQQTGRQPCLARH